MNARNGLTIIILILVVLVSGCTQSAAPAELSELPEASDGLPLADSNIEEPASSLVIEESEDTLSEPTIEVSTLGLVAHFTFESDATDSAGSYDAKLLGNPTFETGKIGNAMYFDGVDDYVALPDRATEDLGELSQGTIAFWFKFESLLDKQTVMPIFFFGMDDGPDNMYLIEIGHSAGDGRTDNPDPSDTKIYSTWVKDNKEPFLCFDSRENLNEGEWYHYVVVVGDDGNAGYLNGVQLGADYNFGHSSAPSFLSAIPVQEQFLLGYGRSSFMISPDFVYFKGYLDDVRIYDRALSVNEIVALTEV